jgi:hypothetical protein
MATVGSYDPIHEQCEPLTFVPALCYYWLLAIILILISLASDGSSSIIIFRPPPVPLFLCCCSTDAGGGEEETDAVGEAEACEEASGCCDVLLVAGFAVVFGVTCCTEVFAAVVALMALITGIGVLVRINSTRDGWQQPPPKEKFLNGA